MLEIIDSIGTAHVRGRVRCGWLRRRGRIAQGTVVCDKDAEMLGEEEWRKKSVTKTAKCVFLSHLVSPVI